MPAKPAIAHGEKVKGFPQRVKPDLQGNRAARRAAVKQQRKDERK